MSSELGRALLALAAASALVLASCSSQQEGPDSRASAGAEVGIGDIAFGRVLPEGESGSGAGHYRHWDAEGSWQVPSKPLWTLEEPILRCRVLRAVIGRDHMGFSSITITLTPSDSERLGEFSARLLDQQMAFLVDDLVVLAPVVADPLHGSFEVSARLSPADAQALLERIVPPR